MSMHPRLRSITSSPLLLAILLAVTAALILSACNETVTAPEADSGAEPADTEIAPSPTSEPEPEPTPTEVTQPEATPTAPPDEDAAEISSEPAATATEIAPTPEAEPEPEPLDLPDAAFLGGMSHMYQTFNNCSAASVCMLLSHYDVVFDQEQLRPIMRPNDGTRHGKTEYMIGFFREQGFKAHLMHGGDVDILRAFIAHDIPVIVQQWLELDETDPIGHYSVVRGYDHDAGILRLNDSMHGEDFRISYQEFVAKWRAFSYRYIPVYPAELQPTVDRILGDEVDLHINRERTVARIQAELEERPDDAELLYSLGTNLHDIGHYQEAIEAYELAASIGLPPKMLWYVYWPAEAYNELRRHEDALRIAEEQITSAQTFGDMRYERARALEHLGQTDRAIAEYHQALRDDPRLERAEEALRRLGAL